MAVLFVTLCFQNKAGLERRERERAQAAYMMQTIEDLKERITVLEGK